MRELFADERRRGTAKYSFCLRLTTCWLWILELDTNGARVEGLFRNFRSANSVIGGVDHFSCINDIELNLRESILSAFGSFHRFNDHFQHDFHSISLSDFMLFSYFLDISFPFGVLDGLKTKNNGQWSNVWKKKHSTKEIHCIPFDFMANSQKASTQIQIQSQIEIGNLLLSLSYSFDALYALKCHLSEVAS